MKHFLKLYRQDKYFTMFACGAFVVAIGLLIFAVYTAICDYQYWKNPN